MDSTLRCTNCNKLFEFDETRYRHPTAFKGSRCFSCTNEALGVKEQNFKMINKPVDIEGEWEDENV